MPDTTGATIKWERQLPPAEYGELRAEGLKFCPCELHVGNPYLPLSAFGKGQGYCRACSGRRRNESRKQKRRLDRNFAKQINRAHTIRQRTRRRLGRVAFDSEVVRQLSEPSLYERYVMFA